MYNRDIASTIKYRKFYHHVSLLIGASLSEPHIDRPTSRGPIYQSMYMYVARV